MRITGGRGWVLEHAVTGRSKCRRCKKSIAKDSPRIGFPPDLESTRLAWMHPPCASGVDGLGVSELLQRWPEPIGTTAHWRAAIGEDWVFQPLSPDALQASIGRLEAMRDALQTLWRATRSPDVAQRIQSLSALDPEDPIRDLGKAKKSTLTQALRTARTGPLDARWADLILPWFETPPFSNAYQIWHHALAVLDRQADPRTFAAIRGRTNDSQLALRERFGSMTSQRVSAWLEDRVQHGFPEVTGPTHTLVDAYQPALAKIDQWIAQRRAGQSLQSDLLHRAAAGDDSALNIYADHLCAADDVRGEFIQLAQLTRRTPEQRERIRELMKSWWLLVGELHPVAMADGLSLRRGLPVEMTARPPAPVLRDSVFHSADWASVAHLEIRRNPQRRSDPGLVLAPHARRLESVILPDMASLAELLQLNASNPAVKHLVLIQAEPGSWERKTLSPDVLPNLESLRIRHHGSRHNRVLDALRQKFPNLQIA